MESKLETEKNDKAKQRGRISLSGWKSEGENEDKEKTRLFSPHCCKRVRLCILYFITSISCL